jgi:hypothetical protein
MNLADLIPATTREVLAREGLHKVAGAMYGVPELNVKEAARLIGAKAFLRRKEARVIANGIAAFAAVTNEKVAENPALMALLRKSVMPAALGAGIGGVTHMMNDDPNKGSPLMSMGAGALMGGVGGGLNSLNAATRGTQLAPELANAIQNLP